jgi:hypothetical protein
MNDHSVERRYCWRGFAAAGTIGLAGLAGCSGITGESNEEANPIDQDTETPDPLDTNFRWQRVMAG